jgi:hypothetical protein
MEQKKCHVLFEWPLTTFVSELRLSTKNKNFYFSECKILKGSEAHEQDWGHLRRRLEEYFRQNFCSSTFLSQFWFHTSDFTVHFAHFSKNFYLKMNIQFLDFFFVRLLILLFFDWTTCLIFCVDFFNFKDNFLYTFCSFVFDFYQQLEWQNWTILFHLDLTAILVFTNFNKIRWH